jgi:hypothetical protein
MGWLRPSVMQYLNRQRRKALKVIEKEMEDLRFEHESLEILRDCPPLWDAIHSYLTKATLNEREKAQLREAMQILCRGRTGK